MILLITINIEQKSCVFNHLPGNSWREFKIFHVLIFYPDKDDLCLPWQHLKSLIVSFSLEGLLQLEAVISKITKLPQNYL
jgi:hypothetical protein